MAPCGGQIRSLCKCRHLVAKFGTNASGAICWPNLALMQVAFYLAGEITQVIDAIPWVRCASGNVFFYICHCPISPQKKDVKMYQCLPGNDERMSDVRAPPRLVFENPSPLSACEISLDTTKPLVKLELLRALMTPQIPSPSLHSGQPAPKERQ